MAIRVSWSRLLKLRVWGSSSAVFTEGKSYGGAWGTNDVWSNSNGLIVANDDWDSTLLTVYKHLRLVMIRLH